MFGMEVHLLRREGIERYENLLAEADLARRMRASASETSDGRALTYTIGSWLFKQMVRFRRAAAAQA